MVTAVGIAASIQLDRLRAERMFAAAAGTEIAAVAIYLVLMVALILADASLAVIIALSGALPLLSGAISGVIVRRRGLAIRPPGGGDPRHTAAIVPTAGWLLVIELSNLAMYASGPDHPRRVPHAARRGPVRGPGARAQPAVRARRARSRCPTVPTASRYVATGDDRRLRELAVRGSRYTLALFVPLCVTLMVHVEADRRRVARRPLHGRRHRAVRSSSRTGSSTAR